MRISDWSSDVCSSDLLLRPSSAYGGKLPASQSPSTQIRGRGRAAASKRVTRCSGRYAPEDPGIRHCTRPVVRSRPVGLGAVPRPGNRTDLERDWAAAQLDQRQGPRFRSEEHTYELQSLMRT